MESARDALTRINPHIAITPVNALLDDAELAAMIAKHDLVLDCTDNVAVRNQLNAGCFAAKVPLVSGAAIRMEGKSRSSLIRTANRAIAALAVCLARTR